MTSGTEDRGPHRSLGTALALLGGVLLLPAGALWAAAGAIRWRSCLSGGLSGCAPDAGLHTTVEWLLGLGILLQALGLLLVLVGVGLRRQGRLGILLAGTAAIALAGARIARATRRWAESPPVLAEVGYGIGVIVLGLVTLYVVRRDRGPGPSRTTR